MNQDRTDCKGCFMITAGDNAKCAFGVVNTHGVRCPCQTCLVKTMCKEGCQDFDDMQSNVRPNQEDNYNEMSKMWYQDDQTKT